MSDAAVDVARVRETHGRGAEPGRPVVSSKMRPEYAQLKRRLAVRYPLDRDAYTADKEPVMHRIVETVASPHRLSSPRDTDRVDE